MEKKEMKRMLVKAIIMENSRRINECMPMIFKGENFSIMFADSFVKLKELLLNVDDSYEEMIQHANDVMNELISANIPEALRSNINTKSTFSASSSSAVSLQFYTLGNIAATIKIYKYALTNGIYYNSDYTDFCRGEKANASLIDEINAAFPVKYYDSEERLNAKIDELAKMIFPKSNLSENIVVEKLNKILDRVYKSGNPDSERNDIGRRMLAKYLELPAIHTYLDIFGNNTMFAFMCSGEVGIFEKMYPEETTSARNMPMIKAYASKITEIVNKESYSLEFMAKVTGVLADKTNGAHLDDGEFVYDKEATEADPIIMGNLFDMVYDHVNGILQLEGFKPVNHQNKKGISPEESPNDEEVIQVFKSKSLMLLKGILDFIADSSKHSQVEMNDSSLEIENGLKEVMKTISKNIDEQGELKKTKTAKKTKLFN